MPIIETIEKEFGRYTQLEINFLLLGQFLGKGASREVYVCGFNPRWVIKVEFGDLRQNIMEQMIWNAALKSPWAAWLAPVLHSSPDGRVIIQERTRPAPKGRPFPDKVPDVLADVCERNWGWLRGRWVCHDYGLSRILTNGFKRARLVPVAKVSRAYTKTQK